MATSRRLNVCPRNTELFVERNMKSITYAVVRKSLAETMKMVCDDHAPVIITRKAAKPVIMMSLDDYEALEETAYLLRSPKNVRRLIESIAELEAVKGLERELADYAEMAKDEQREKEALEWAEITFKDIAHETV
jgi:antitoxin YefM